MKITRHLLKSAVILGSLLLCMVVLVTVQNQQWGSTRLRLVPRFVTEKEIRGRTYHVHRGEWKNRGYDHINARHKESNGRLQFKQVLKKKYPRKILNSFNRL